MKGKDTVLLVVFLIAGLLGGSLLGEILRPWLPFITNSKTIYWTPAADLVILKYDLQIEVKLNIASIAGLALGFWTYRKLK